MDHLVQEVVIGHLHTTFDTELLQLQEKQLVRRFWDKDPTIWPAEKS